MSDTGWVLGFFMPIEEAQWMNDPALCLRACSRLRMSDWEYSQSAEVWLSVCRHNRAQNTFWRMLWSNSLRYISEALPLGFRMVSHILSKLDCVVTPSLCWWSLQKAYWACYMLPICAIHCWEMIRAVPNWSCPKWECETISVSSLFNLHMSWERRKQPCSKPLTYAPSPSPSHSSPKEPQENAVHHSHSV